MMDEELVILSDEDKRLRDEFAGQAMAAMIAQGYDPGEQGEHVASAAYNQADLMLRVRFSRLLEEAGVE